MREFQAGVMVQGGQVLVLAEKRRTRRECCCNHTDAERQSDFWQLYAKVSRPLLNISDPPKKDAQQVQLDAVERERKRLQRLELGRSLCCPNQTLEGNRRGRCSWMASTGSCMPDTHLFTVCPVACGACTLCKNHSQYGEWAAFYADVRAKKQPNAKIHSRIQGPEDLGSTAPREVTGMQIKV